MPPTSPPANPSTPPADRIEADPTEVFQKAFWRRPSSDDQILHAERREWLDDGGVSRWQWFLEVKPSPELVRHLREDNAFSLRPESNPDFSHQNLPAWFTPATTTDCLTASDGSMTLTFSEDRLLATGEGGGFQQGSTTPLPKSGEDASTPGRLPNHSPPNPGTDER